MNRPEVRQPVRIAAIAMFGFLLFVIAGNERADLTFAGVVGSYAILAVALDLAWGYAGILSIGHALYFGGGAYLTALLVTRSGITDIAILTPLSALVGAGLALVVGLLVLYGHRPMPLIFVAMTTLASSYVAQSLASSTQLLGSDTGIPNARPESIFGVELERGRPMLILTIVVLTAMVLGLQRLLNGGLGTILTGIRESEDLLHDAGFPVGRLKLVTFVISGAVAGVAGSIYTANVGFVSPGSIGYELSTLVVVWVLAGGVGILVGAMYGVMLVEYLTRYVSSTWVGWKDPILGVLLLLVVLGLPSGITGLIFGAPSWLAKKLNSGGKSEPLRPARSSRPPAGAEEFLPPTGARPETPRARPERGEEAPA